MAEPIGLASGLLALASFAFQSSIALYQTLHSFQSHPKRVRDLLEELETLSEVLSPLNETIRATADESFSALDLPLLRCGNSCKEFEQEIIKCTSRSAGGRTSFRDWAKLKYMGEDIDGFRRLLAGYKLTITIALTDANLRKTAVTAEALEGYQDLIKTTTADLEAHLASIDEKLEAAFEHAVPESDADAAEKQLIKEEQLSTRRCLQICARLSEHIGQIQLTPRDNASGVADPDTFPEHITSQGLQECKNSLQSTAAKLETYLHDLMDRMISKSRTAGTSTEDFADLTRLREEWKTTRQCMEICSQADHRLKENITTIDNYATGDAIQFMVSTDGNIVHGKNRGLGWRTRQVGGHLNDASLQQLSRDMVSIHKLHIHNSVSTSQSDMLSASDDAVENAGVSDFRERYGQGFKLTSKSTPTVPGTGSGR
ncbi:hypothetical protein PV08_07399 [Exophiala spinifera]|uniref:Azaphilone pigments biosynthesis cluster protein L N-terminal domain-containing protein n=1 Tax=Exophiala spinifera TaxID=91928 RepID=A0A0D2B7G6_9EURO|nr:uncharacterized protein PV08_07399 [Exophiala spinifera]KIW14615.1 hypothetical protein PV08_07399 [Exophiala spinifera]